MVVLVDKLVLALVENLAKIKIAQNVGKRVLFLFFHSRRFSRLDRQCEAVLFGVARPNEVGALDVHLLLMFRIKMFVIITIIFL